jgi:hypothetical protein
MAKQLDLSRGQTLTIKAGKDQVTGMIIASRPDKAQGFTAVVLTIDSPIVEGAPMSLPAHPEAGGCGQAHVDGDGTKRWVLVSISNSCVQPATIGK